MPHGQIHSCQSESISSLFFSARPVFFFTVIYGALSFPEGIASGESASTVGCCRLLSSASISCCRLHRLLWAAPSTCPITARALGSGSGRCGSRSGPPSEIFPRKFKLRRGRRRRGCSYSEKDDIDPCIDGIDHSIEYGGSSAWHRAWHQAWHRAQHRARHRAWHRAWHRAHMQSNMASSIWHRAWHRAWHEHVMMLGHATSTSTCNSHSHVLAYVLVLVRVEGKPQRVRSANRHWGRSNRPSDARSELARH